MSYYKDKRVLVAGSTGLAGMALTRRLQEAGARVRALVHTTPPPVKYPNVEYAAADLTRPEDCARVVKDMEIVFMCAANTSGAATISAKPLVHVTPNIIKNALMLEASFLAGVKKFMYLSSTTSYPDKGDVPVTEEDMFVGDPPDIYFPVGWMKRYTEKLCRLYSEKLKVGRMTAQVLRPTNIYGPFDDFRWETSHVLAALIRKVIERQNPLEVWGTGDDVRDLIYVEDLADACLSIMEKSEGYNPVNVGLGKGYTVKEMLKLICEIDGYRDAPIVFNTSKPQMIAKRLVDVSKAERVFGFKAKTGLPEGIRKTIAWYRENTGVLKK